MNTLNDSELSILNKSVAQLNHFITAAHQTRNANLLRANFAMLADAPAPAGTPDTTNLNDILNNAVKFSNTNDAVTIFSEMDDKWVH